MEIALGGIVRGREQVLGQEGSSDAAIEPRLPALAAHSSIQSVARRSASSARLTADVTANERFEDVPALGVTGFDDASAGRVSTCSRLPVLAAISCDFEREAFGIPAGFLARGEVLGRLGAVPGHPVRARQEEVNFGIVRSDPLALVEFSESGGVIAVVDRGLGLEQVTCGHECSRLTR